MFFLVNLRVISCPVFRETYINSSPVISSIPYNPTLNYPDNYTIKASGRLAPGYDFSHYICISYYWQGTENTVYSFDNSTGVITPAYSLEITSQSSYIPEFNKDSSVLYLGYDNLYAVDLLSSYTGSVNMMLVYGFGFFGGDQCGAIQRNKYDDIYISLINKNYLGKIINPNVYGNQIGYNPNNTFIGYYPNNSSRMGLPQLVPNNSTYDCPVTLVLNSPETSNNNYQVSNTIVTENNYAVNSGYTINMKAGNSITLSPNTFIKSGSDFLAQIENCPSPVVKQNFMQNEKFKNKVHLSVNLEKDIVSDKEMVSVYPNPVSTSFTISSKNEKFMSWELYDFSGKNVLRGNSETVNIQDFPNGNYILKLNFEKRSVNKTIIKK